MNQNGSASDEKWRQNYVPAVIDELKPPKHTSNDGAPPVKVTLEEEEDEYDRGQWGSKWEFVLSCVGLSVGIGNVWRFPYLAYENGGGAFLLPYFILLVFIGKPMYMMETALGQYSQLGPLSLWRMAPVMKGVGAGMCILCLIVSIYYNVIMAYTLFYMFASFASEVPWAQCHEWWGADQNCYVRNRNTTVLPKCSEFAAKNITFEEGLNCTNRQLQTASEQYWNKYVLAINDGLDEAGDIGGIKWDLALCLLLSWCIVFLCLCKGVKSSGKVVYFTATFPYVILIALLIRGVTLEGAHLGIYYFFVPTWKKLLDVNVWLRAAEQMFFSLGVSWGGLIMFGSYNKFKNKVHIDAMVVSSLDFITSIIAGIVIFSVLGSMANELSIPVEKVATGGQGLAFIAYPEAISRLPISQLWAVLFFFMLYTLGLDSEFALLETVLTAIYDEFPRLRSKKIPITGLACFICFLAGLPCVSNAGQYILNLMDTFGGGTGVLFIAVFEMIGVMWVYGVRNFSADVEFMLGFQPNYYWKVCWSVVSPVALTLIFILAMANFKTPDYAGIPYPPWAIKVGWFLAAISVCQIPIWGFFILIRYATKGRFKDAFRPEPSWGPGDKQARRELLLSRSNLNIEPKYTYDNPSMEMRQT